jgi:hypothetical protein
VLKRITQTALYDHDYDEKRTIVIAEIVRGTFVREDICS